MTNRHSHSVFAIGDVHGQSSLLTDLLSLHNNEQILFLGDYIDRGPDSNGVIDTCLMVQATSPDCVFLRGNHEQMMLDARTSFIKARGLTDKVVEWFSQGGSQTIKSYGLDLETCSDDEYANWPKAIPPEHWDFVSQTVMEYETEDYLFVHAGWIDPGTPWEYDGLVVDPRLWVREPFLSSTKLFRERRVVFGHTPQKSGKPLVQPNKIGLDTGAAFGGPLTAALVNPDGTEVEFVQVRSRPFTKTPITLLVEDSDFAGSKIASWIEESSPCAWLISVDWLDDEVIVGKNGLKPECQIQVPLKLINSAYLDYEFPSRRKPEDIVRQLRKFKPIKKVTGISSSDKFNDYLMGAGAHRSILKGDLIDSIERG